MTPAITGLTYVVLTEFAIQNRPSVAHHVARFLAAVAMATYSVAGSFNVTPDPEPVATSTAQLAVE